MFYNMYIRGRWSNCRPTCKRRSTNEWLHLLSSCGWGDKMIVS